MRPLGQRGKKLLQEPTTALLARNSHALTLLIVAAPAVSERVARWLKVF